MYDYLKPKPEYASLTLAERLEKCDLAFQPMLLQASLVLPYTDKVIKSESWSVVRTDNDSEIGSGFAEGYHITPYAELFGKFDEELMKDGFVPSGCQSFDNGGGARMFYTKPVEGFGQRLPGFHNTHLNGPRQPVFSVRTSLNGKWPTSFGGYMFEQWCSNGAVKEIWKEESFGVRHTKNHDLRLTDAISRFNWIAADMSALGERLNKLALVQASSENVKAFLLAIVPDTARKEDSKRENKARENQRAKLGAYVAEQAVIRNRAITFEDLLQGVTAYNTHEKADNPETVFERILSGKGVNMYENALAWVGEQIA